LKEEREREEGPSVREAETPWMCRGDEEREPKRSRGRGFRGTLGRRKRGDRKGRLKGKGVTGPGHVPCT